MPRTRCDLRATVLARCADPVAVEQYGRAALHLAAQKNSPGVLQKLLDAKVPVDAKDNVRASYGRLSRYCVLIV